MNDYDLAVNAIHDWLINTFEDADLFDILDGDPEGSQLIDGDFDRVLDIMKNLKVSVHVQ